MGPYQLLPHTAVMIRDGIYVVVGYVILCRRKLLNPPVTDRPKGDPTMGPVFGIYALV